MAKRTFIGVNDDGRRVGESHHRAKLSDEEIELIRQLRELLNPDGSYQWSYGAIAKCFQTSKGVIHDICSMRRRNQFAVGYKAVRIKGSSR